MADRHHEGVAYEDHQLIGADRVALRLVDHGLDDGEQGVVVDLQLGALMCAEGVLHRQGVQPELAADEVELLLRGLVQSDPDKGVPGLPRFAQGVGEVGGAVGPAPVPVNAAVHDHARILPCIVPPRTFDVPSTLARMPTLILVRHGRSTANTAGVLAGRTPVSPSTNAAPNRRPRCPDDWPHSASSRPSAAPCSGAARRSSPCSTPGRGSSCAPRTASANATTGTGRVASSPSSPTNR